MFIKITFSIAPLSTRVTQLLYRGKLMS